MAVKLQKQALWNFSKEPAFFKLFIRYYVDIIGKIVNTNNKGQLVIPNSPTDDVYPQILEKTVGAWNSDGFDNTTKKRRKIELEASDRRRTEW